MQSLENPQDISRLVIFDTWTLNCDRHPPDPTTRKPNKDNVFLSSKGAKPGHYILKAMDHTHCFTCGDDLTRKAAQIDSVKDERLYGLFPGFLPYLRREDLSQALTDLGNLEKPEVEVIVNSAPQEWQLDQTAREALVELICLRAAFLIENSHSIIERIEQEAGRDETS